MDKELESLISDYKSFGSKVYVDNCELSVWIDKTQDLIFKLFEMVTSLEEEVKTLKIGE